MNSSCSAVSTAPGRTERTLAIASMPSEAQPVSMRSIDATVPARPRPPLQCTTILLPDKSSAASCGPMACHGRSSRESGAAPSLIGRPCHIKPCALARSAKEIIRSSSNSHGSINVIRCCAPHATMDARSISKSRAQDPVIAASWCFPGAKVTPIAPPFIPIGRVAICSGWELLVLLTCALRNQWPFWARSERCALLI